MWIASKFGYYSIVKSNRKEFSVRARAKKDIENLVEKCLVLRNKKIIETEYSDYMFRIIVEKSELDILMIFLSNNIDYHNFKDKIKEIKDQEDKLTFYTRIWATMLEYQEKINGINLTNWSCYFKQRYGKNSTTNTKDFIYRK